MTEKFPPKLSQNRKFAVLTAFSVFCVFGVSGLYAQGSGRVTERLRETLQADETQRRIDEMVAERSEIEAQRKKEENKVVPLRKYSSSERQPAFYLKKVEYSESSIFHPKELEGFAKKYEGRQVSVADVYTLVDEINQKYKDMGYVTSKAFLPEQDIQKGVLKVQLFEGRVGKAVVKDYKYTSPEYVEQFLGITQGSIFSLTDIEQKLINFNAANEMKSRVAVAPGQSEGLTDIDVVMEEPNRFNGMVFTDNAGQKSTGYYRGGVVANMRKVSHLPFLSDILTAGGVFSEGSSALFGSYVFTEPVLQTTWTFGFDWSDTEVISGPLTLANLDVKGDYYNARIGVKRTVYATESNITSAGFTASVREGNSFISGMKIQETKTDTLMFNLDNLWLFDGGYLYNSASVTRGLTLTNGTSDFWSGNYNLELQSQIVTPLSYNIKFKGQISDRKDIPSSCQMQIGGINTIRGYAEGMLAAGSGYVFMTELKVDLAPFIKVEQITRPEAFVFFDCGQLVTSEIASLANINEKFLSSTGGGIRASFFKTLSISGTVAVPLTAHPYNEFGREVRFLFNVSAEF